MMFLTRRRNKKSNVNLSHVSPTTLAPGNLIPISFTRIFAGDDLRFKPSAFVQAMPMNAPLVNGFKLCLEYFFVPDRLYNWDLLADNTGITSDPDGVKLPQMVVQPTTSGWGSGVVTFSLTTQADVKGAATLIAKNVVSPGSLADYCGFPVGILPTWESDRNSFSALKMLGVLDIFYHYYVNQQIPKFPTASFVSVLNGSTPAERNIEYEVAQLRSLLDYVKRAPDPATALKEWIDGITVDPLKPTLGTWEWFTSRASIFQRCLPPYYLESWLATSGYEDSEIKVDLEADGKSISFRNIATQSHIQRWLDLALAGGSRYSDYINSQFDVSHLKHTTTPLYLGSDRDFLGSNVIYQTTGAGDSSSPLGAFAGQAAGGREFRQRSYHFGENGYFVVMASLVPDVIYTRGLDPFNREKTLADVYVPALDNIAMQPLKVEEVDALGALQEFTRDSSATYRYEVMPDRQNKDVALGFVPAWSQLLQNVSRAHGRLTTDLKYWLLARDYGVSIEDLNPGMGKVSPDVLKNFASELQTAIQAGYISSEHAEALSALIYRSQSDLYFTPYVLPNAYNDVFADISNQAQNFVLTPTFSMTCNREKGKVNTPTTI